MPADFTVHAIGAPVNGNSTMGPLLPAIGGQAALANDADSNNFTLTSTGVLAIVATAKVRMSIGAAADALTPATSPIVLLADQRAYFTLERGTYKLRVTAYV